VFRNGCVAFRNGPFGPKSFCGCCFVGGIASPSDYFRNGSGGFRYHNIGKRISYRGKGDGKIWRSRGYGGNVVFGEGLKHWLASLSSLPKDPFG
jgi:hypothetical protein